MQGLPGPTGAAGAPGVAGPVGTVGPTGPMGPPGPSPQAKKYKKMEFVTTLPEMQWDAYRLWWYEFPVKLGGTDGAAVGSGSSGSRSPFPITNPFIDSVNKVKFTVFETGTGTNILNPKISKITITKVSVFQEPGVGSPTNSYTVDIEIDDYVIANKIIAVKGSQINIIVKCDQANSKYADILNGIYSGTFEKIKYVSGEKPVFKLYGVRGGGAIKSTVALPIALNTPTIVKFEEAQFELVQSTAYTHFAVVGWSNTGALIYSNVPVYYWRYYYYWWYPYPYLYYPYYSPFIRIRVEFLDDCKLYFAEYDL
jgi:hypothetical protein